MSIEQMMPVRKNGKMVEKAFQLMMAEYEAGRKPVISKIMLEAGYSPYMAKTCRVHTTMTWKQLMDNLPNAKVMKVFTDLIDESNEDKRTRLEAAKEVCKLKDLYPGKRLKIEALQAKNDEFLESGDEPLLEEINEVDDYEEAEAED